MKLLTLEASIIEAKRFLAKAEALRRIVETDNMKTQVYGPAIMTGSVRRASLDLTRALADLRRREG